MAFQVWLDFGSGWEDITSKLFGRFPISRTRAVHAKGDPSKPVIGTAHFKIARDTILVNRFLSASGSIAVKIQKDGAAYFLGQIRDTHKVKSGLMSLERFDVECVDALMRLEKRCTVSATWSGYSVSNPSNKAASILHQLFYAAGFADAELNLAAIAITIDRFSLDKTRGDTYRQIFERILLETGFSAKPSPAGVMELYDLGPASITPIATLSTGSAGNIAKEFEIAKNEAKAEAVDVSFWSHLTLADAILFEDTTGGGALPCSIPLTAGSYYPQGADANHDVRAELTLSDYEIIAVDSAAVEWDHTGDVVKQVETIEGLGVRIRFYSATGGVLTKLRIRGNALVRGDLYKVIRENVANTEKRESIELSTIYTTAAAERVAIIRANWHANSRFDHVFPEITLLSLAPGDYVQLTDTAILGSSQVLRVVQIEDGADPLSIKVLCEGASPYSYVALPRTVESGRPTPEYPPAIGGTPVEIIADRTPPSVPASVSSSQLSTGALRVGFSASLDIESGVSHYRIYRREQGSTAEGVVAQVLEDGSGSYIVDDTSPVVGKSYEFAVSAVDKRGNESALSSWTAALASVVTDAPPNVAGTPTAKASAALMVVTWAVVNGAVAYRVERSTDSGSTWPTSFTAAANRLEDPIAAGVEIATLANYRYRVKALSIYQALSTAWATSGAPDTTGYGTYVPAAPTVSYNAAKRSILAQITPQANLLNPDGWDVQISRDQTNWYCPNLAAKVDADGWYTGALNGSLHLYEPSVKLNYLPIPTSGTPALPAAAGQGYYLRVRARCSSPAAQSGWTTSAILTVTPTLGIDFAAAQVYGQILKAGGVLMDRLSVLARNYVNNPTLSGNVNGWGAILEDGSGTSAITSYDATEKALKITSAASHGARCAGWEIDHSKIYKIVVRLKKSASSGMVYVGLRGGTVAFASADDPAGGTELITPINPDTRAAGTPTANFYSKSWAAGSSPIAYETVTFYVLGAYVSIDDMPKGITGYQCAQLAETTNYLALRFLNYNNTVSTNLFVRNISVSEIGAGTIVAENIYAIALSAITASLGEITAGKLYSFDYDPGVAGFVIDLDTGEIHSESGGWSIFSDGTVEFNGGTIGGISFDATKLFVGAGNWGNADTPAYLDSSGFFSLLDKIKFDPTTNTLTIKSDALETEEGGGFLNHEGRSLVWRDAALMEKARIVYDASLNLLKANPLGALVEFKGSWIYGTWQAASVVIASSCDWLCEASLADGNLLICYRNNVTSKLVFSIREPDGTLTSPVVVVDAVTNGASLVALSDGSCILFYTKSSTQYIYQKTRDSGGTWGGETALVSEATTENAAVALKDSSCLLVYVKSAGVLCQRIRNSSGLWGNESVISALAWEPALGLLLDGRVLLTYGTGEGATNDIAQRIREINGSWGSEAIVNSFVSWGSSLVVAPDGRAFLFYQRGDNAYIDQRIRETNGTWGPATTVVNAATRYPLISSILPDGKILLLCPRSSDSNVLQLLNNSAYTAIPLKTDYCRVGAGIEEIGSNSNGSYIKFSDGTLMCYGKFTTPAGTYYSRHVYPYEFKDFPAVSYIPRSHYGGVAYYIAAGAYASADLVEADADEKTGFDFVIIRNGSGTPSTPIYVSWNAFGRWK